MSIVHVVAIITTKPGMRETVLGHFHANMPAVHAEDGCIEYQPTVDTAAKVLPVQTEFGADTFVVIEKWASADALKAHAAAPHMAAYGAKVKDMIASRVIHVTTTA
jgi:quinol monooxygenase YgiN